jgi:hypothetical protein
MEGVSTFPTKRARNQALTNHIVKRFHTATHSSLEEVTCRYGTDTTRGVRLVVKKSVCFKKLSSINNFLRRTKDIKIYLSIMCRFCNNTYPFAK